MHRSREINVCFIYQTSKQDETISPAAVWGVFALNTLETQLLCDLIIYIFFYTTDPHSRSILIKSTHNITNLICLLLLHLL